MSPHLPPLLLHVAGVSKALWYGTVGDKHMFVVELLGANLEDLLGRCGHKFSLTTVLMLADQMVRL